MTLRPAGAGAGPPQHRPAIDPTDELPFVFGPYASHLRTDRIVWPTVQPEPKAVAEDGDVSGSPSPEGSPGWRAGG